MARHLVVTFRLSTNCQSFCFDFGVSFNAGCATVDIGVVGFGKKGLNRRTALLSDVRIKSLFFDNDLQRGLEVMLLTSEIYISTQRDWWFNVEIFPE